jgi:hypothetical protein
MLSVMHLPRRGFAVWFRKQKAFDLFRVKRENRRLNALPFGGAKTESPFPHHCRRRNSLPQSSALRTLMRTKSRSSGSEVVLLAPPYRTVMQWLFEAFVVRYSGATARDSHPIPYSPKAMALGTFRLSYHLLCLHSKNSAIYSGGRFK